MANKFTATIIITLLINFLISSCANKTTNNNKPPLQSSQSKIVSITTAKAETITAPKIIDATGTFLPVKEAVVSSLTDGVIIEISAELGDKVIENQIIAKLDNEAYNLQLAKDIGALEEVKARLGISNIPNNSSLKDKINIDRVPDVRQAKANLDQVQLDLLRAESMVKDGYWPPQNLENAKTKFEISKASYQAAKESVYALIATMNSKTASIEITKKHLHDTLIKAPFSGQVRERLVNKGEYVKTGASLISMVSLNPIKLQIDLPEKFAEKVSIGQQVNAKLDAIPNKIFTGKISRLSPISNVTSRSYTALALFDNPNHLLKPGFFASANIIIKQSYPIVVIPENSILSAAGVNKIFVISNGTAHARQVVLGESRGGKREVLEGVVDGELIATSRLGQLFDGAKTTTIDKTQ